MQKGSPRGALFTRLRSGGAQHLVVAALGGDRELCHAVGHVRDGGAVDHLDALVGVGNDHGTGEPHEVAEHAGGVADPVGDDLQARAHRPHAVGDDAGQADGPRVAVGEVDLVEVGGGARVADDDRAGDADAQLGKLGSLDDLRHCRPPWCA